MARSGSERRPSFEQNVVRDADLADIAEQGADANAFDFIFEEAAFVG